MHKWLTPQKKSHTTATKHEAFAQPTTEAYDQPATQAFVQPATQAYDEPATQAFDEPVTQAFDETATQASVYPTTRASNEAIRRFCGIDPEALSALLYDEDIGENVILDIPLIHIDISYAKQRASSKQTTHIKPMSTGVVTFICVRPKMHKHVKSSEFKKPYFFKPSTNLYCLFCL